MPILDEQQQRRAIEAFDMYQGAPPGNDGQTPVQKDAVLDSNRRTLIAEKLQPLVEGFLSNAVPLAEFKTRVDGINRRANYWGFSGMKGQMFFNMLVNGATDPDECAAEIQSAIAVPLSEDIAKSRMRTFSSYVGRVGDELVASGGTGYQRPRLSSIPLYLSYFWQISDPDVWPVMYTTSCNAMSALNLWQQSGNHAEDYLQFTGIQKELQEIFSIHTGSPVDLYQVEHVFWFLQEGRAWSGPAASSETASSAVIQAEISQPPPQQPAFEILPDSYAPPIVSILPRLACPDEAISRAAANSGISVSRAFEKSVHAALTVLGFDTRLLGQGSGREPDGLALNAEESYAIIWDAKSRSDTFSLGTEDRAIREYITRKSRELRRQYRNIYFLIISGSFQSDFSDAILEIKMDTEVKEVCLLEAGALVAIVETYLKNPRDLSLGPDGLQRIFARSQGIVTKQTIIDFFG